VERNVVISGTQKQPVSAWRLVTQFQVA